MDTRLGYPSEHLAGNNSIEISSPMFATAVGLVMNSTKSKSNINQKNDSDDKIDIDHANNDNKSEKIVV